MIGQLNVREIYLLHHRDPTSSDGEQDSGIGPDVEALVSAHHGEHQFEISSAILQ